MHLADDRTVLVCYNMPVLILAATAKKVFCFQQLLLLKKGRYIFMSTVNNHISFSSIKSYDELTFSDDFMFCRVLSHNPDLCKEFTEIVTGRKVSRIISATEQKTVKVFWGSKGIRFDVYFEDEENVVYDFDMQTTMVSDLPRRTRYYQSMIDADNLMTGHNYKELPQSYIVFVCLSDPFKSERYIYSFIERCKEDKNLELGDGTTKIFLNATGKVGNISPAMQNLLGYIHGMKPADDFTRKIEDAVTKQKMSEDGRHDYMLMIDKLSESRAEGRAEGIAVGEAKGKAENQRRMVQLIGILTDNNDFITLKNIAKDPALLEELYKKYNI